MLRIFFKYNRRLLGELCRLALQSPISYFEALTASELMPGVIIAFLTDYAVVDRIIDHLKLTFVTDKPPPPHIAYQDLLMAAESSAEFFFRRPYLGIGSSSRLKIGKAITAVLNWRGDFSKIVNV